jgi:hypothetical protein
MLLSRYIFEYFKEDAILKFFPEHLHITKDVCLLQPQLISKRRQELQLPAVVLE